VSGGISTDPDVLMQAAQGFASAAQDMYTGLQGLQSTVTSNNPWGGDEQGSIFGTLYVAVLGHAMQSMASHLDKLGTAAEGVAVWSQQMSQTETAVHAHMTSLGRAVAS
jgi:hypothetical protein